MTQPVQLSRFDTPGAPWSIRRKERIPAPPERVWQALVSPAELASWWCDEAEVDARPGGRYAFSGRHVFRAGEGSSDGHTMRDFEILECAPNERLAYRWWLGGVETRVEYELANLLEITELTVTQSGARSPAWETGPETPTWWWPALPALRSHVEGGRPDLRLDWDALLAGDGPIELAVDVYTFPWIVWHKLVDATELDRWIGSGASVDLAAGVYSLGLGDEGPTKILAHEPERLLACDWRWPGGAVGTVSWRITDGEDATRLTLRDDGPWDADGRRDLLIALRASQLLDLKQMSQRGVTPREYQG